MVVRRTIGLAVLAMALSTSSAAETPQSLQLGVGAALEGEAKTAGKRQVFVPAAAEGDYVKGKLRVTAGRFDLDIVDADGRHLRRLAENAGGLAEFQFVAGGSGERLVVTGRERGVYTLTIDRIVAREDQRPSSPTYLSPVITGMAAAVAAGRATDDFWAMIEAKGTPLVEEGEGGRKIVTFLGRGAKRNIRLFGAPSGDHEELQRLAGSDIWSRASMFPPARVCPTNWPSTCRTCRARRATDASRSSRPPRQIRSTAISGRPKRATPTIRRACWNSPPPRRSPGSRKRAALRAF